MSATRSSAYRRRQLTPKEGGATSADKSLAVTFKAMALDDSTHTRLQRLPKDTGLLLATAGIIGIVVPGVLGMPFLVLGGLLMWPSSKARAERWLSGQSPRFLKGSVRQINRFLDDLERRYPQR